ncbi:MAG: hypothetical protein VYD78_03380 [Gemmatimonadota bacterium]|nr:hypothetical protein [Gemmatimonadota bacterium]
MREASVRVVRIVEGVRAHLLGKARLALALCFGAAVTAALVLAWVIVAPEGWRQGTPIPLVIDSIFIGMFWLAWVTHRRVRTSWLSEPNLAHSMEEKAELARGLLRGSLELARALPRGVSASLASRAAEGVLGDLRGRESELAGRMAVQAGHWIRRGFVSFSALVALLAVLTVAAPGRSFAAWSGLANPLGLLTGPTLPPVEVSPGSVEVLRGTDVVLEVSAPGRTTSTLHWQAVGDISAEETLVLVEDRGSFVLRGVSARTDYWVSVPDGARSPLYRLQPVDPLLVGDVTVELTFPPHTGRFPEEHRSVIPPLTIPAGSQFTIHGRASRPLGFAGLDDEDGQISTTLALDGRSFEGKWIPRESGLYAWRFVDVEGGPAEVAPAPLSLTLVPDSSPDVEILLPGKDTLLPVSLRQPLLVEGQDDYGLDHLELVVYRVTAFGDRMQPVEQPMAVGGTRGALIRPVMDLTRWELLPGDTVRYFVRAIDNSPVPNVSETREYVLWPPTAADLRREAQERLDDAARNVEELAERAEQEAEQAQELERQLDAQQSKARTLGDDEEQDRMEFGEQEDVRSALEDQQALLNAVDSLEIELAELNRDLQEGGLKDPNLQRELSELQRLLDELAPESLQERLQELSQRMENMDREEADQILEELVGDQQALRDRLEEALDRFRQAAMEQDFRATAAEAEELAQQEEALADAMKEGDNPELRADQQESLSDRAEELGQALDELQKRLAEAGEEMAQDVVEQAQSRGEQAQQEMLEAARQSRRGDSENASKSAQEAAEAMQQMAQELQQGQQEMAQQLMQASQEALRKTATDALSMARAQSEVRNEMRGTGLQAQMDLRGDEAALLEGVRNMANNLAGEMNAVDDASRAITSQMGRAMQAMQQTLQALGDQRGRTPSPLSSAEDAVGALNELALMAMAAAEQMGQGGQGQSGQEMMEQLEQLAQQQGSVNNQTGQLTPMKLGEQAMASQLQQIAERQEQIAEGLEGISEEPTSEVEPLGDLEAMALEALELAERLAGNRLDVETLQRQERLFRRLLDAGRSLEKDEFSEERESSAPGVFERRQVDGLSEQDLGTLRFQLPPVETLRRLSPAQRQMVLDYFERLNRAPRTTSRSGGTP